MSRRITTLIFALVVMAGIPVFALTGCGGTTETIPSTTVPATADPGYLAPQAVDLMAITNLGKVDLNDAATEALMRQSFVAVSQPPGEAPWKFWNIYEEARYTGLPVLITTDSLLNAYHGLFDTLMQRAEEGALFDQVVAMTEELYASAYDQWAVATDPTVKADLLLNMAYFAVAAALLEPDTSRPVELEDVLTVELELIEDAAGTSESSILGYTEDYSQYKPRGHYTRSERLQRYFKAMMWYGHTGFFINPREPDVTQQEADSLTRRALLIASLLTGPAKEAWSAVYEPTSVMVGRADDLTADYLQQVITQVYGVAQPEPDALADAAKLTQARTALNALPAPKIQSAVMPDSAEGAEGIVTREENQRSFRVMGQRYIPDSYALQQLVWDHVGTADNKRTIPMGLDVMSALGSGEAYRLQTESYGEQRYANWDTQLQEIKQEFAQRPAEIWPQNLYTGWLESLQLVMAMPDERTPAFMRSRPWALKSLNAALGSWTELRHDTILYAKQSMAAEGEGGEEPVSPGYVEPYPAFYDRVSQLAASLRDTLTTYDLLAADSADKLEQMIALADSLAAISRKELEGTALSEDEISLIQTYGGELESLDDFGTDAQGLTLSPSPEKCPVVADIHTDYVSSPARVLEEATGYPLYLYVVFELDGALQIFVGASYAYYEFTAPLDKRLTDEEWVQRLDLGTAPPRPTWTDEWIIAR